MEWHVHCLNSHKRCNNASRINSGIFQMPKTRIKKMKMTKPILLFALVAALVVGSTGKVLAHYDHDDKGWFDEHHHHHVFILHEGHRGYWDHDDHGVRVFINI